MTVKELITELLEYDLDREVVVEDVNDKETDLLIQGTKLYPFNRVLYIMTTKDL